MRINAFATVAYFWLLPCVLGQFPDAESTKATLVGLLRDAAKVEHVLLNAYLVGACSIKSRPEEFEFIDNDFTEKVQNDRRAIHFEFARDWRTIMLGVAKEEMLHLHYVNCLLRALGERPEFGLPTRSDDGAWLIEDWVPHVGERSSQVRIPLERFSLHSAETFVLYESTDALQSENPLGEEVGKLFESLRVWELKARVTNILRLIRVGETAPLDDLKDMRSKIFNLYNGIVPDSEKQEFGAVEMGGAPGVETSAGGTLGTPTNHTSHPRFSSIADLYLKTILPYYEQAFENKLVPYNNVDLNNEIQEEYKHDGVVPIGPVMHPSNFLKYKQKPNPLDHFRNVEQIVKEIVMEGEGFQHFEEKLHSVLNLSQEEVDTLLVEEGQGVSYDKFTEATKPAVRVRTSHLYSFSHMLAGYRHEIKLAKSKGLIFDAGRSPVHLPDRPRLKQLIEEMPKQFNAVYLVMCSWMSRMYELPPLWKEDENPRQAIESLAAWPLMSLGLRPFLELASFFGPEVLKNLFRQDADAFVQAPPHALQLLQIFLSTDDRTQAANLEMDFLAVRVLDSVAVWAKEQEHALSTSLRHLDKVQKEMILSRFAALSILGEFKNQFKFRKMGGLNDRMPDSVEPDERNIKEFEENATRTPEGPLPLKIYDNTLLLRIRFIGWGRVQLATEPEPPTEEVGSSGTLMVFADDPYYFDRSIFWREKCNGESIVRGPKSYPGLDILRSMPGLGVKSVGAELLVVKDGFGAVKNEKSNALDITGAHTVASVPGFDNIGVDLLPDPSGRRPYFNGYNFLIAQPAEPVSPFVFSLYDNTVKDCDKDSTWSVTRSAFSEKKGKYEPFINFTPIQRINTDRWPLGLGGIKDLIPDWVKEVLPAPLSAEVLANKDYPGNYLQTRAEVLFEEVQKKLDDGITIESPQRDMDSFISLTERLQRLNYKGLNKKKQTYKWPTFVANYAHTLSSGAYDHHGTTGSEGQEQLPILKTVSELLGSPVTLSAPDRYEPNGRWLVRYSFGVMDSDALATLVYGDVFIPLQFTSDDLRSGTISKAWPLEKMEQKEAKIRVMNSVRKMSDCKLTKSSDLSWDDRDAVATFTSIDAGVNVENTFTIGTANEKTGELTFVWSLKYSNPTPEDSVAVLLDFSKCSAAFDTGLYPTEQSIGIDGTAAVG